jgi:hypothetical protein
MNKKSAFQWGRRIRTGVGKIDAGNIAGLGGVMRVLVVERSAARRPLCYHHLGALRTFQQCSASSILQCTRRVYFRFFFIPRAIFRRKRAEQLSSLFFFYFLQPWLWLSFHLIFSPFTTHIK